MNQINQECLEQFSYDQLLNYRETLQKRIKDLKEFDLDLGRQNTQLTHQYNELVQLKKKQGHNQIIQQKKGIVSKWIDYGKEKIDYGKEKIDHLLHPKNHDSFNNPDQKTQSQPEPQKNHNMQRQPTNPNQAYLSSPDKKVGINNFDFDDLYQISKDKISMLIGKGTTKVKAFKDKVMGKEKQEQIQSNVEQNTRNQPQQGKQNNYSMYSKLDQHAQSHIQQRQKNKDLSKNNDQKNQSDEENEEYGIKEDQTTLPEKKKNNENTEKKQVEGETIKRQNSQ